MISIIVCSINEINFHALSKNIQATVGVPFEIIRIDNSEDNSGICEVYNKGIGMAKYQLLCFVHEDILFNTSNWGKILADIFSNKEIGLTGIAGSCYYSLSPIGWFGLPEIECNLVQQFKYKQHEEEHQTYSRFPGNIISEVVVVDGVFMATRKDILAKNSFDEKHFPGFHGYDIDLSLQIGQHYKVIVTKNILITHFSEGKQDIAWQDAIKVISRKWFNHLPVYINSYLDKEIKILKIASLNVFCLSAGSKISFIRRNFIALFHAAKQGVLALWLKKILHYILKQFRKKEQNGFLYF